MSKHRSIPKPSALSLSLREQRPAVLIEHMSIDQARAVIDAWQIEREAAGASLISAKTQATYRRRAAWLIDRYAKELGLDASEASPVVVFERFLQHAAKLAKNSWSAYRSALLAYFQETRLQHGAMGYRVDSYLRATALLIVFADKPVQDRRRPRDKPRGRPESISQRDFDLLAHELRRKGCCKDLAFAVATMTSGARPSEWRSASTRLATASDMSGSGDPSAWRVLEFVTGKTKAGALPSLRTMLIPVGEEWTQIEQHLKYVREVMATDPRTRIVDCMDSYIKVTSGRLARACRAIWPRDGSRWITLYTLRSQARANFVVDFGEDVAAALLGHAHDVGRKHYAPRRLGTKKAAERLLLPGRNVLATARAKARPANQFADGKPWEKRSPEEEVETLGMAP